MVEKKDKERKRERERGKEKERKSEGRKGRNERKGGKIEICWNRENECKNEQRDAEIRRLTARGRNRETKRLSNIEPKWWSREREREREREWERERER
jgi:hypothetical protein